MMFSIEDIVNLPVSKYVTYNCGNCWFHVVRGGNFFDAKICEECNTSLLFFDHFDDNSCIKKGSSYFTRVNNLEQITISNPEFKGKSLSFYYKEINDDEYVKYHTVDNCNSNSEIFHFVFRKNISIDNNNFETVIAPIDISIDIDNIYIVVD